MQLPAQLLRRKPEANKKDFGHLFILAGSAGMLGAAALTAKSALRSGAGLVSVGVAKSLNLALQKKVCNEVMTLPLAETKEKTLSTGALSEIKRFLQKVNVLAIGPGLSKNTSTQSLIRKIVKEIDLPIVIDADALNALAGHLKLLQGIKILTPHPGEMARLLGISVAQVQKRRKEVAKSFARKYNCILVLKG
jgi:Predicted sugar kinase